VGSRVLESGGHVGGVRYVEGGAGLVGSAAGGECCGYWGRGVGRGREGGRWEVGGGEADGKLLDGAGSPILWDSVGYHDDGDLRELDQLQELL